MNWYSIGISDVLTRLNVDARIGLSDAEARRRLAITKKRESFGKPAGLSLLRGYLRDYFTDYAISVILYSALAAFLLALRYKNGIVFPTLTAASTVLNTAAAWIDRPVPLTAPPNTVRRGGRVRHVNAMVSGDILLLQTGDAVQADARILDSGNLIVDESALTGIAVPVPKTHLAIVKDGAPLRERMNMVFAGSTVLSGVCTAAVTTTGRFTEVGKIYRASDRR